MNAIAPTAAQRDYCLLRPGNTNCGGCGMSIGLTMLDRALAEAGETCSLVIPACCGIVTAGAFPTTSYGVPTIATTFASSAAVASGVASIRDLNDEPGQVICWAGDGGTYDIGLQALSGAAERNDDVIYVCYDNEAYMNTGVQRSGSTPVGAWTSTTPAGKPDEHRKKDIVGILAAHQIPYVATASVAFQDDLKRKFRTAIEMEGFRFLLLQTPCPTGWRSDSKDTIKIARLGVTSGLFPLL